MKDKAYIENNQFKAKLGSSNCGIHKGKEICSDQNTTSAGHPESLNLLWGQGFLKKINFGFHVDPA